MNDSSSYTSPSEIAPIVLLHGWGMNRGVWQHIQSDIETTTGRPTLCLDLPGYGDNIESIDPYSLEKLVDWLASALPEKAQIVAWSMSGLIATEYALRFPERVEQLALVATSPKFVEEENWPGIKPTVLSVFASQLEVSHKATIERFMAIQAMGSRTAKEDIKRVKNSVMCLPDPCLFALRQGLTLLQEIDLRQHLKQITVPVNLLLGRLDSLVPVAVVNAIEELDADINITVLPKASHAPFISHPDEFLHWLKGL